MWELTWGLAIACLAGCLIALAVTYWKTREVRRSRVEWPPWPSPSSGILIGDTLWAGASLPDQSTASILGHWAVANGATIGYTSLAAGETVNGSWAVVALDHQDLLNILAPLEQRPPELRDEVLRKLSEMLLDLKQKDIEKVGLILVYNPLSGGDFVVLDSMKLEAARFADELNSDIAGLADEMDVDVLNLDRMLHGRAIEFTRIAGGGVELNNIGHAVQAGLIQDWILTSEPAGHPRDVADFVWMARGVAP